MSINYPLLFCWTYEIFAVNLVYFVAFIAVFADSFSAHGISSDFHQSVLIDFLVISCVLRLIIFLSANIVKKLEDSLGSIETVKGYVEVRESASLVSLEFFKSLTSIQPKKLSQDRLGILTCS